MLTIPSNPLKFLGCTVLSFNANLGLGSTSESSLTVELVEDCENGDAFAPNNDVKVGDPVLFPSYPAPPNFNFRFGGVLQSWTYNIGKGGKTYSCTVTDPRQLLENTVVVFQNYMDEPEVAANYFNVYTYLEGEILHYPSCAPFGNMGATERGVPYNKIILALRQGLQSYNRNVVYSPTGAAYYVNFESFIDAGVVPDYFRIPGPSISLLDLLQLVCDAIGYSFYVTLDWLDGRPTINIGYVDLRNQPANIGAGISSEYGSVTDLSYGQELRNDKTRSVIIGEQQHYMSWSDLFTMYFGEDYNSVTSQTYPIVPVGYTPNEGFWIYKSIRELNSILYNPIQPFGGTFDQNGPYFISELDIRAAMSSYDIWETRVLNPYIPGGLNDAIKNWYGQMTGNTSPGLDLALNIADLTDVQEENVANAYIDMYNAPGPTESQYDNVVQKDLEAIHSWVSNLGTTYYGKQWACLINKQKICVIEDPDSAKLPWPKNPKFNFSDIPTSAGGWVEYNARILGVTEPDLGFFKSEDGRLGAFLGYYNPFYLQQFKNYRQNPESEELPKPEEQPENNNMTTSPGGS